MINKKQLMCNYIKNYSNTSISKICKELNIDNTTISKGTASEEKISKVFNELLKQNINNLIEVLKNYESTIL